MKAFVLIVAVSGCRGTRDYCERLYDFQLAYVTRCPDSEQGPIDIDDCREQLPEGCDRIDIENLHRELDCGYDYDTCDFTEESVRECLRDVPDRTELCHAVHHRLFD